MTPARKSAHRLLGAAAAAVLAASLGLTASPAGAATAAVDPLVWGNAQAWAANGDAVSGYSTAVSFGGDSEERGDTGEVYGPLAPYISIRGSSRTAVDDKGAAATAGVESAVLRLTVVDLVTLGMIDVPSGVDLAPSSPDDVPSGDGEDPLGPYWDAPTPQDGDEPEPRQPPADGDHPFRDGESESPAPESPSPSGSPTDDVIALDDADTRRVSADNTLEISVADVVTTASAGFSGRTDTGFEHGALSAFGVPVGELRSGRAHVVEDVLEIMDEDGETVQEVPVAVHFARVQETFDDEDPDWRGEGSRSRLSVTVSVGAAGDGNGFSIDFADAWALGSTYATGSSPSPQDRASASPQAQEQRPRNNLAMTGSSLAALITAALVAVGGGSAATFLARKRTSAMDDRLGD